MRTLLSCLGLLAVFGLSAPAKTAARNKEKAAPTASAITLYRDHFGVPSVEAKTLPDALYGLGYAMTLDCAEKMARNYKQARGRTAEVDGKSALTMDGFIRSLGIEEIAAKRAQTLPPIQAEQMNAFLAGANRALAEQKSRLPDWIEPFTPTDVLALAQLVNAGFALSAIANELLPGVGSNQFAVAPKRSANGHALISMDPHLPWSGPLMWYEFSLYAPEMAFRGITIHGLPYAVMGHNAHVAWCMTNNNPDLYDFFTVKTNPANQKQYRFHGEWRDFEEVTLEMKWREAGELKSRTQSIRRTAWGPMLPFRSQAVQLSMLGSWELLEQSPGMMQAHSAAELRQQMKRRGFSMWNIVYGDVKGTIGYQYNGRIPKRDTSFDWTKPVPGDDPRTKWGELWSLDDLPRVENPASGLLANANSAPWLTPLGSEINKDGWPRYVTSYGPTTRYERLAELLSADKSITVEEAKRYATDTQVPYARAAVEHLLTAYGKAPGEAVVGSTETEQALRLLQTWNGRADVDARGCALYVHWLLADRKMHELAERAARGVIWSPEDNQAAMAAMERACRNVRQEYGRLDPAWGEMQQSERGKRRVPIAGIGYIGGFGSQMAAVMPTWGRVSDGRITATGGSSFRMIVDLDPKGIKSWSILPYGNAQNPANPHYADQMEWFGQGKYKETFFGLANAKRAAQETQKLR